MTTLQDRRVAQAHAEVGTTAISRPVAITLASVFAAAIAVAPGAQVLLDPGVLRLASDAAEAPSRAAPSLVTRILQRNRRALDAVAQVTDRLDNESLLAEHLRPTVQLLLTGAAGTGNERVYPGRGGWLFFATDVRHVLGRGFLDAGQLARRAASGDSLSDAPAPDPRPALRQLHQALSRRGITLVLLPTPVKPTIHPERLGFARLVAPVHNVSFIDFVREMRAQGLQVFDPTPVLTEISGDGEPAYLATDTHWRPEAVVEVAEELARFVDGLGLLPARAPLLLDTRTTRVANQGDTAGMLNLPPGRSPFRQEQVELQQVLTPEGELWRPDPTADVLLLGDSFSNIYSLEAMGWGEAAGLAEQLSVALGRPVDRLTQNDNGAFATREALARELARRDPGGTDRLDGKRLVVYQFATRELSHGDWRLVGLDPAPPTVAASALTPAPGQRLTVRGRVRQRAPAPRPGTVPYRDHIIAVDLGDIVAATGDGAAVDGTEALVYLSSMEDNVWTAAATLAAGQTITLTLRPWAEVAPELDGITRAELVDGSVVFATPWWGELREP